MFLMRSRGGRGDCAPTTGQTAIAAGGALPAEVAQIDRLALGAVRAKKIPVANGKIFIAGDNLAAGFTEPDITATEIGGDGVADRPHSVEGGNRDPIGSVAQGPVDLVGELKDAPYGGAVEKFRRGCIRHCLTYSRPWSRGCSRNLRNEIHGRAFAITLFGQGGPGDADGVPLGGLAVKRLKPMISVRPASVTGWKVPIRRLIVN